MPTADVDVGTWQRVISASIGALITSLLVTPLDVTKTRMQVQNSSICDGISCEICADGSKKYQFKPFTLPTSKPPSTAPSNVKIKLNVNTSNNNTTPITSRSSVRLARVNQNYYIFSNGLMDHQLPTARLRIEVFESACKGMPFKNSLDAFYKIARHEGVTHLYTGLGVTLWMAAPATVLYYSTYDILRNALLRWVSNDHNKQRRSKSTQMLSTFMPLISGMTGRVFAASVISPLELMRTQMMARTINRDLSIWQGLKLNFHEGGFLSLWKGLIPTLWRDVPFSGIYWMGYEYYKDYFIRSYLQSASDTVYTNDSVGQSRLFMASFLSGATSGCIATIFTQPFDVMKTRRQAALLGITNGKQDVDKRKLVTLAKSMYANEGVSGFFIGLPARITRVPIACAIMVSTYEVGKILLKRADIAD